MRLHWHLFLFGTLFLYFLTYACTNVTKYIVDNVNLYRICYIAIDNFCIKGYNHNWN